jgi:hypothetical protein
VCQLQDAADQLRALWAPYPDYVSRFSTATNPQDVADQLRQNLAAVQSQLAAMRLAEDQVSPAMPPAMPPGEATA